MTNFGAARIRQDSLTQLQLPQTIFGGGEPNSSTTLENPVIRRRPVGRKRVGQSTKISRSAPNKEAEELLEEITQPLRDTDITTPISENVLKLSEDGASTPLSLREERAGTTGAEHDSHPGKTRKPRKRLSLSQPVAKRLVANDILHYDSSPSPGLAPQVMRPTSFLIASLGNPPPYHSTRHSAAHIVLKHFQSNYGFPSFTLKSKPYGGGHVSVGADIGRSEFTLWQSPSLMNISGPPLLKAWKNFLAVQSSSPSDPITGLVVLHDEMETEPGRVKVKRGNTSARGHNGLKSVQASFQGAGLMEGLGDRYIKIGVGIGRPSGGTRETRDVSAYVLGQLTAAEKDGLERATSELESVLYQEMARIGFGAK